MSRSAFLLALLAGIVSLSFPPLATAQSTYDLYGSARADGLGWATTAAPLARGVHANPAASAAATRHTATFYAQQAFGLRVLRYGAVSVVAPFRWATAVGGASTFGFEDYREIHFSAGGARSLSLGTTRSIHLGLLLRYHHTRIAGYGSAGALALNPGLLVEILPSLHLGAHATNVNGATLAADEPLPRTFALGLAYEAYDDVRILADLYKDMAFPATVRAGVEVSPIDALALRAGVTTTPTRFTGGVGVSVGPLEAHVAARQHQQLGWSPSASLHLYW